MSQAGKLIEACLADNENDALLQELRDAGEYVVKQVTAVQQDAITKRRKLRFHFKLLDLLGHLMVTGSGKKIEMIENAVRSVVNEADLMAVATTTIKLKAARLDFGGMSLGGVFFSWRNAHQKVPYMRLLRQLYIADKVVDTLGARRKQAANVLVLRNNGWAQLIRKLTVNVQDFKGVHLKLKEDSEVFLQNACTYIFDGIVPLAQSVVDVLNSEVSLVHKNCSCCNLLQAAAHARLTRLSCRRRLRVPEQCKPVHLCATRACQVVPSLTISLRMQTSLESPKTTSPPGPLFRTGIATYYPHHVETGPYFVPGLPHVHVVAESFSQVTLSTGSDVDDVLRNALGELLKAVTELLDDVKALQTECKKLGLADAGEKADLVARLAESGKEAAPAAAPAAAAPKSSRKRKAPPGTSRGAAPSSLPSPWPWPWPWP